MLRSIQQIWYWPFKCTTAAVAKKNGGEKKIFLKNFNTTAPTVLWNIFVHGLVIVCSPNGQILLWQCMNLSPLTMDSLRVKWAPPPSHPPERVIVGNYGNPFDFFQFKGFDWTLSKLSSPKVWAKLNFAQPRRQLAERKKGRRREGNGKWIQDNTLAVFYHSYSSSIMFPPRFDWNSGDKRGIYKYSRLL